MYVAFMFLSTAYARVETYTQVLYYTLVYINVIYSNAVVVGGM